MEVILAIILFSFILLLAIIPIHLIARIICMFKKNSKDNYKIFDANWFDVLSISIILLAYIYSLASIINLTKGGAENEYYSNCNLPIKLYAPLAPQHIGIIYVLSLLGFISAVVLYYKSKKLSPIIYCLCSTVLILNIVYTILYVIQVCGKYHNAYNDLILSSIYVFLYCIICLSIYCVLILKKSYDTFISSKENMEKVYKNKFLFHLRNILMKSSNLPLLWSISIFPVLFMIQLILVLLGQQPDSFIKVFLDTSDYTLSTLKTNPVYVGYPDGHYLCTVSVQGHKNLVKPIRQGYRHGHKILVNRQLLVANAFENILEQYTPRLHKVIRDFYNKYGFPISKYITTPIRADVIYILMKPLEYIFLFCLYLVDKNPENRIAIQYVKKR